MSVVNIDRIAANPLGRIAHLLGRPLVHFLRRAAHPGIPTTHTRVTARYADRKVSLEIRRWSQADAMAVQQCFAQSQYDMPTGTHGAVVQSFYDRIIASGHQPLIIDCGANIGASVAWFSLRYPRAHIIAVEPAPENFALLRQNTLGLDVDLREAGIAATDGHAFLRSTGTDMGYQTTSSQDGPPVQMLSIATLLADKSPSHYTPFLLKIDIEGSEQSLFSGDTSACDRFPLIVLEPHDWLLPGQLTSQPFFQFHASAGREFCMNNENIASIALHPSL